MRDNKASSEFTKSSSEADRKFSHEVPVTRPNKDNLNAADVKGSYFGEGNNRVSDMHVQNDNYNTNKKQNMAAPDPRKESLSSISDESDIVSDEAINTISNIYPIIQALNKEFEAKICSIFKEKLAPVYEQLAVMNATMAATNHHISEMSNMLAALKNENRTSKSDANQSSSNPESLIHNSAILFTEKKGHEEQNDNPKRTTLPQNTPPPVPPHAPPPVPPHAFSPSSKD